ncbi:ROK family protein, partial [Mycobacterium tuberculosis]|nr:ROK family protein [Mycobacterium tuberculosis]
DQPLAVLLADRLGCPVALENDVNIAALGEARIRPAAPSLAFISFGTGVGLGLVVDDGAEHVGEGGEVRDEVLPHGRQHWDAAADRGADHLPEAAALALALAELRQDDEIRRRRGSERRLQRA